MAEKGVDVEPLVQSEFMLRQTPFHQRTGYYRNNKEPRPYERYIFKRTDTKEGTDAGEKESVRQERKPWHIGEKASRRETETQAQQENKDQNQNAR